MKKRETARQFARRATDRQGFKLALEFRGIKIALVSDHAFSREQFQRLADYVTGMELKSLDDPALSHGRLVYIPAADIAVQYRQEALELILRGPDHCFGSGNSLAYIAQYMAECLRTSQAGVMLIHAAAVQAPDQNVSYIILGEKGAGKTTLALRLCHQHGYRLIGNDQIFLGSQADGSLVTAGGNAWFNLRQTAVLADPYLAELQPDAPQCIGPAWDNKRAVAPAQVGIDIASGEFPVKAIFRIRIDRTQPEVQCMHWQGVQRNLILHECFGRHISGQATPLQDDRGNYLGSLPPINQERARKARDALVDLVIKAGVLEIFAPDSGSAVDLIMKREQQ